MFEVRDVKTRVYDDNGGTSGKPAKVQLQRTSGARVIAEITMSCEEFANMAQEISNEIVERCNEHLDRERALQGAAEEDERAAIKVELDLAIAEARRWGGNPKRIAMAKITMLTLFKPTPETRTLSYLGLAIEIDDSMPRRAFIVLPAKGG